MAQRFWVGGTSTWDTTVGTKWALTSGGAGGQAVPTATDDVFFDAASGVSTVTVTASTSVTCNSLTFTGFTGTFVHDTSSTITVAGSLTMAATMTYTGNTGSFWAFTSATSNTITQAGFSFRGMSSGGGGTWTLQDSFTIIAAATWTHGGGTIDFNGKTVSLGLLSSANSNVRTITFGTSNVTFTGTGTVVDFSTNTNLTVNATSSTITCNGAAVTFQGGAKSYGTANFTGSGTVTIGATGGNPTFVNFNRTATAIASDIVRFNGGATISGAFTVSGNSITNRLLVQCTTFGTRVTITCNGTISAQWCDFQDVGIAGTAAPLTGTSIGDAYNNAGITFTTPVNRYWVGGTGNFSSTTHWATSTGGASGASIPLCHDNVFFDASSGVGTATADTYRAGKDFDFTGYTGTFTTGGLGFFVFGSFTLAATMTYTSGTQAPQFSGRGTHTVDVKGLNPGNSYIWSAVTGTYTLASNLTYGAGGGNCQHISGTLNLSTFTISCNTFALSGTQTRTLDFGSGAITMTGTGTVWNATVATSLTIIPGTGSMNITNTSVTSKTFIGGSVTTYPAVSITGSGTGAVIFQGANLFASMTIGAPKTVTFPSATVTTVVGAFTATGSLGNVITINSSTGASAATLYKPGGLISCDWLSLQDSAATGTPNWYAGANSTNVSGNSGWIFTAPPAGTPATQQLPMVGVG